MCVSCIPCLRLLAKFTVTALSSADLKLGAASLVQVRACTNLGLRAHLHCCDHFVGPAGRPGIAWRALQRPLATSQGVRVSTCESMVQALLSCTAQAGVCGVQ